ncbi:hypothetical protein Q3G72_010612 [Acer saccharum]|nr:hypothetical protein Q3G72_010612 [Acer saccharum]
METNQASGVEHQLTPHANHQSTPGDDNYLLSETIASAAIASDGNRSMTKEGKYLELEAKNPTLTPTEALTLLNGKWIGDDGGEISQTIDLVSFTVQNSIQFAGPLATTSISTNAKFEIKFEEGVIGTPQVTDSTVLPENEEFLGQKIDLTPFKGFATSVQDTASSIAKTISSQPRLKFSISNSNAQS